MKKYLFLLIVIFVFFGSACGAAQGFDELSVNFRAGSEEIVGVAAYSYANMQRNVPAGNYMDDGDKILFSRLKEHTPGSRTGAFLLYVMDKDTEEVRTFCKDASCPHTALDCYAANAESNIEEYNGKLYAKNRDNEIMELKDGRFQKIAKGKVRYFWHGEGRLFAVTWDNSLVETRRRVEDGDLGYDLDELYLVGIEDGSVRFLEMPK